MACYDDVDFVRQYIHHSAIASDEYADFVFDVPVAHDGDSDYEDSMERSLSRGSLHRTRTTRERRLGLNILEDYRDGTFLGDRGDHFGLGETISTITSEQSFSGFYNRRSKRTSFQADWFRKRGSGDVKNAAVENLFVPEVDKNKVITWSECPIDSEKLAAVITEKRLPVRKANVGNEKDSKSKKEKSQSPFVKAVEAATSMPANPLATFYQYLCSEADMRKGCVRNEFRVIVNLDEESLEEIDVSKFANIRFVPSCRVYNLIGLILYLHSINGSGNSERGSFKDLPSYNVEDYQLLGLADEEDDPDIESILLDNNSKADQYSFPCFILQYRGKTLKPQPNPTLPITVHIHMVGRPLTNTIKIYDRYSTLRYIHEEGMKYFFKEKPNYGAPYVMVSYNEQDRGILDLNQTLMDTKTRSFQLRRINCKATNLHDVSSQMFINNIQVERFDCLLLNSSCMKKKENRVFLTYSSAMIELDHVNSHAVMDNVSTMFSNSPNAKIAKLASWMPEQVVECTADSYPADSVLKILVYFKCRDIAGTGRNSNSGNFNSVLPEDSLAHANFRCLTLKMNYPSDQARTKLDQLITCLSKDKYVEISPYEKLWDFQSDQVKAKILSRALPF